MPCMFRTMNISENDLSLLYVKKQNILYKIKNVELIISNTCIPYLGINSNLYH